MLGTLAELKRDMESGIYDFTKDGECSSCGKCCSNILPMSSKEIKEIHRYMRKHKITEQRVIFPLKVPAAFDLTCPFRSEKERKCLIYECRPNICRDFRCDKPRKQIQANKEMYHGRYEVVDMREEFFGGGGNA